MLLRNMLSMHIHPKDRTPYAAQIDVKRVGCSRNADRDVGATEKWVEEMRSNGYQVHGAAGICFKSRYLITNEDAIEVQGPHTSGEVEFVVMRHEGAFYVSVGSDHNDRSLGDLWTAMLGKVYDTAKTKQMVPAVVGRDAWLYDEVRDHWDEIVLKSFVTISNQRIPYQEFRLGDLLDLEYYLNRASWVEEAGSILFGGTGGILSAVPEHVYHGQATVEGVSFPSDFQFEMVDPVLDRTISHEYSVVSLEEPGSLSL